MTYNIVLVEKKDSGAPLDEAKTRAVGEHVFLANLPTNPKVFAFFYPGDADTDEVARRLRLLGHNSGDNLFVNIGTLVDPDYKQAVERFGIGPLPVIVVTGVSPLASTPDGKTAFVRLDGKALFASPEKVVQTVEELLNLFLSGKIAKALLLGVTREGGAYVRNIAARVWAVVQPVITWIARKDVKIGLMGAEIEVRDSGSG